jgi:hypothetical protein
MAGTMAIDPPCLTTGWRSADFRTARVVLFCSLGSERNTGRWTDEETLKLKEAVEEYLRLAKVTAPSPQSALLTCTCSGSCPVCAPHLLHWQQF